MRLRLYSSVAKADMPNLVALQDEILDGLPTVLVCPFRTDQKKTVFRVEVNWDGKTFVACPELTRPIHRKGLRPLGQLSESASRAIMHDFFNLLAH